MITAPPCRKAVTANQITAGRECPLARQPDLSSRAALDAALQHVPSARYRERAKLWLRLCTLIARRKQEGRSVTRSCRLLSKIWNGTLFKTAPEKSIHLSEVTLRRVYFGWRGGKNPSALLCQYAAGKKAIASAPAIKRAIVRVISKPGTESLAHALRLLREQSSAIGARLTARNIYRGFTRQENALLHQECLRRHAARRAERAFARFLKTISTARGSK